MAGTTELKFRSYVATFFKQSDDLGPHFDPAECFCISDDIHPIARTTKYKYQQLAFLRESGESVIPQENISPVRCFKKSAVSQYIASDQRYDNNLCFVSLGKYVVLALQKEESSEHRG